MKKVYHLHIPRCSGIYVREHLLPNLKSRQISFFASHHIYLNEKDLMDRSFISGHFGTKPIQDENQILFTMLRDPVDRYISNFLYITKFNGQKEMYHKLNQWVENPEVIALQSNLQYKMLSNPTDVAWYNNSDKNIYERANNGWCLDKNVFTDPKSVLNKCEIVGLIEEHSSFIKKLNNLLEKQYGFSTFLNSRKLNGNGGTIEIPDSLKRKIEEVNSLDMEMYEYARSIKKY
ncbi:Sulfotransferase [uncultured Caudovirales phage]|uniref:Sulfotransferase n=1 Tax=uncultured Caudovirales phage TaxID=2100421 RepID=A0A6J7WJG4_9CAUD|nr:Sulfotransferase [uncultured Caudovirales phage]